MLNPSCTTASSAYRLVAAKFCMHKAAAILTASSGSATLRVVWRSSYLDDPDLEVSNQLNST